MTDTRRQRPRILITRPAEDAVATAEDLTARGYEAVLAPLMAIEPVDGPEPGLSGVQALLTTSANGIRAFARRSAARDIPVLAVGDASAGEARNLGFTQVSSAGGDVGTLANMVLDRCRAEDGALLHVAGSRVAGDLGTILERAGHDYRRIVLYRMRAATALPAPARTALANRAVEGVMVYSPRTASILAKLVIRDDVSGPCAGIRVFCLSAAVAEKLADLTWRSIHVAERPDRGAMLACLDSVLFATPKG